MASPRTIKARMPQLTLSVLVPLYNEEEFVRELLVRVVSAVMSGGWDSEIIVVDDRSTDGSAEIVEDFMASQPGVAVRLIRHDRNQGKGAAIRTAISAAEGHYTIIQDADLEYDPAEYLRLLTPLIEGRADVVFGSRFLAAGERRVLYFWHSLANRILTTVCNMVSDLNLTDMETCYKAFRTSLAKSIPIQSDRFGIDPELTVKFARRQARIYETPISYHGRTYEEGKKIGLRDAFVVLWVILRSRFTKKLFHDPGPEMLDALSVAGKFNRWMADTISPWAGARVLEIGAGMGNLTHKLCPARKLYLATDIEPEYLEQLKKRYQHRPAVRVHKLNAEDPGDYRHFETQVDTVICLNVLEHLKDDRQVLESIRTTLIPGGTLILLVPNGPEAYGALDEALGHYRRYTRTALASVLAEAGFHVDRMLEFNRVSWPGWRFTGQVLKRRTLSQFSMRIFDKFVWLWRAIDQKLPWEPCSLIAIARRPE
ncbi:MAG TPA: glycosyltransferase [Bryobacteraceae bacterium]|nr:glycosyltransferase [Bryobacteraceae bacterium]